MRMGRVGGARIMDRNYGGAVRKFKQDATVDSWETQKVRETNIQSAILRVAAVLPSKSMLNHPNPFYEVGRGDLPYKPAEKLQLMMRDVAATARKHGIVTEAEAALTEFYNTLLRDALDALRPEEKEADIVPLFLVTSKESSEALCAQTAAIVDATPTNLERAASETRQAATFQSRLADSLHLKAFRARAGRALSVVRS